MDANVNMAARAHIKRFWEEESATAEASSTVIMVAMAGLLLSAGLALYYAAINGFFAQVGGVMETLSVYWSGG
jgi:Flp pilus assembly pilin Flp